MSWRVLVLSALSLAPAGLTGCTVGGPVLEPIGDQVVAVGDELAFEVRARSPHGDEVSYELRASAGELGGPPSIHPRPDGSALVRWRPTARHVGSWVFDVLASDGSGATTASVNVSVRSALGANALPVFRRPLGAGTAVDPVVEECVELAIETTDQDTSEVVIRQEPPLLEGAELLQESGTTAIWRWCPSPAQRAAQDRYLVTLSADDGENPKALKRYQIVLREQFKEGCAGAPPRIAHAPADRTTSDQLEIRAEISDDRGLAAAPLLYVSTARPADPPDLRQMVQLNMSLAAGDRRAGTWTAAVPNPVADAAPGQRHTLWYVIVAQDDDDPLGKCDHRSWERFEMAVTAPAQPGGQSACAPCTADVQCGGPADRCLRVGVEGDAYCMDACASDADCADGTVCSAGELVSIDGASGRLCVPLDERCDAADACDADPLAGNHARATAQPLPRGTTAGLVLCPVGDFGSEEDWYRIDLEHPATIDVGLVAESGPDVDLELFDGDGALVAFARGEGAGDRLIRCVPAGAYHLRAGARFAGESRYSLTFGATVDTCDEDWWGVCWDDEEEEDDDVTTGRWIDLDQPVHESRDNQICTGDDDWYGFYAFAGETVHAALEFEVTGPGQDLDLLVHDADGAPLTPCSEQAPWACSANGQSGGSNEHLSWEAPATGLYFLVVHGWDGSENYYHLCASLSAHRCPPLQDDPDRL